MNLHELRPAKGATHRPKPRLGRGEASGKGGTSTKGNKGGQSRAGYQRKMHTRVDRCQSNAVYQKEDSIISTVLNTKYLISDR